MPPRPTPQEAFTGVTGSLREWSGLGLMGVVAGLLCFLVTYSLPALQKSHLIAIEKTLDKSQEAVAAANVTARQEIAKEREDSRADLSKSREHGDKAVEKIAASIDGLKTELQASSEKQLQMNRTLFESLKNSTKATGVTQ